VATHSNAHALSPHSRNLIDSQLAAIRETGGIVGVNFEDGVAFGSDFDGAKIPATIGNAAGLQNLVEVMRTRGYGEPLIEKLCYRNWLRVLGQTWGRVQTR
jgi:membrane dipeptidase